MSDTLIDAAWAAMNQNHAALGRWADEHLPTILARLTEAEAQLSSVRHACETWDMPHVWEDSLREILALPIPRDGR